MKIGAAELTSGKTIGAEFCIIGAGPAGLTIASELSRMGHETVVLESGVGRDAGSEENVESQLLNDGATTGHEYAGLRATRHRGIGGTTLLWNSPVSGQVGAKYVPLDDWDYARRWDNAPDGWPVAASELEPWLRRAEMMCGLASFADETDIVKKVSVPTTLSEGFVQPRFYQLAAQSTLIDPLVSQLEAASNVQLIAGATAIGISERGTEAVVRAVAHAGLQFAVRATFVVLAAGAIENARLLLVGDEAQSWAGDRSSWLGCGFMEHPRDRSITLTPTDNSKYRELSFFDSNPLDANIAGVLTKTNAMTIGRIGLSRAAIEGGDLLNASATLLPNVQQTRERIREVMIRRTGIHSFRRWLPESGHGWSRHDNPAGVYAGFTVLLNLEQTPQRANRVRLSSRRDQFGVPLPELTWHWHSDDAARLVRVRELFCKELQRAEFGDVKMIPSARPDPNAHHHAGTTRMHNDPREGVVDANGQVHGSRALYVAGASVFPTAGFANPTLTIIAMALRLANHLHAAV